MENQQKWFGHPKGLFYLFFAELWERFSFYGMRALLTLYMVNELFNEIANNEDISFGIYAAYGALVYATPSIGGRIADKFIGYRKSIMLGGILMALGHFTMVFQNNLCFYGALALLIIGNGFFKPNISTMVGGLYGDADPKRDAGFTIFYMGINIGAWASPLLCGWLGATYGWHYGFGAAGIGMVAGIIFFWSGIKRNIFGTGGEQPKEYREKKFAGFNIDKIVYVLSFLAVPLIALIIYNNSVDVLGAELMSVILVSLLVVVLAYIIYAAINFSKVAVHQITVLLVLTFFNMVFWAFFEQAGSSLVLFAEKNVNLVLMNAAQTNSINPFYIILFAIPVSMMWLFLSKVKNNPRSPLKFSLGIAQLGLGFLLFAYSAQFMDEAGRVPMLFLIVGWLVITTGELFLSPIGLSKVTELSPKKITAFMMGTYFLSTAFSHHLAGQIAKLTTIDASRANASEGGFMNAIIGFVTGFKNGSTDSAIEAVQSLAAYTTVFTQIGIVAFISALLVFALSPWLNRWMHGIH